MNKKFLKRFILGAVVITVVISGGLVYRQYRTDITRAYQRVSSGGKVIDTACGPIQYTEFGEGPPMLLVHGAGGGYDQGQYFAKVIGGNYRWIAPSRFGFLGSSVPAEANSSRQADAHACLLDALGIEQVGVVGVSMGGPSSLLFARQYPHRTNSLAMISAASHAIPPRPAILTTVFDLFLNDFVYWSMVKLSPSGLLVALGVPMEVQQQLSPVEVADVVYPDRAEEDKKLLTYTSPPLETDIEITGSPVVTLYVASTEADGAFHVYLEDVAPDGRVTYLTEGILRAIHHRISDNEPPYLVRGPYHSFKRADAASLVPGKVTEISFKLYTTSVLIKEGHRLRVAVAGHDASVFARYPAEGTPVLAVQRNSLYPSHIELPVMARE